MEVIQKEADTTATIIAKKSSRDAANTILLRIQHFVTSSWFVFRVPATICEPSVTPAKDAQTASSLLYRACPITVTPDIVPRTTAHLSGDERRVNNDHIKRTPHFLGDILRLGEVVQYETGVLCPLGVQLFEVRAARGNDTTLHLYM